MKKLVVFFIIVNWFFAGCRQHHEPVVVTKRIQYDVPIKNPDPEYDWWIQNLTGPRREQIVDLILDGAKSGKYKAYDYFFEPLSAKQVAGILSDTVVRKLRKETPPYELYDTTIITTIHPKDILRLRFLEEWRTDPSSLKFEKIIMGVAPIARRIDQFGNERWQPLFWIIPNAEDAASMRKSTE